jgi:glycosyltransferase involved in cell wall biosynthesis
MLEVSAVVCTLNSQSSIDLCLDSLTKSGVEEIIVVDGGSTDNTLSLVRNYNCRILFDQGNSVGTARKIGVNAATKKYILNCGADNILNHNLLNSMIAEIEKDLNVFGVSCRTKVYEKGVLAHLLQIQWKGRITAGYKNVIGTPNLFITETLKANSYSQERSWSDDEELCERLRREFNCKFIVVENSCFEVGQANLKRIIYRFKGYGRSDFEVWQANKSDWKFSRKIKSLMHPLLSEFFYILKNISIAEAILVFPLLVICCTLRYKSWCINSLKASLLLMKKN